METVKSAIENGTPVIVVEVVILLIEYLPLIM